MLLVATDTKSLPAWQVNRYYGEEKRAGNGPFRSGIQTPLLKTSLPGSSVSSEEPWVYKVLKVASGYGTPALPRTSRWTLSSSESEN